MIVICLLVGVLALVVKRKEMTTYFTRFARSPFLKEPFETEYYILALAATSVLILSVALPFFAEAYDVYRTFFFMSTILSVFFVIGAILLSGFVIALLEAARAKLRQQKSLAHNASDWYRSAFRVRPSAAIALALALIVPYLFCTSGALYSMTANHRSVVFDATGATYFELYIYDQDAVAAKWIGAFAETNAIVQATDSMAGSRLISQGHISPHRVDWTAFQENKTNGLYTYLDYYNVVEQKYMAEGPGIPANAVGDMAEHSAILSGQNKILDTGGSEVFRNQNLT
jgi:uncharacterized membrane protein